MNLNKDKLGLGVTIGTGTSDLNTVAKHMDLAEKHDLEFVELSIYDWNIICGRKIILSELNKLKSLCKNHNLNFSVHGELSVNFLDEENIDFHKEVLKRDIEVASEINASHLVTHFGITSINNFNDTNKFNSLLKLQRDTYEEIGDYAKSHNVILTVENLFNFFDEQIHVPLPNIIFDQLKIINHSNVKATLDFSHGYINCEHYKVDFIDQISIMATISKHLHVHDSFGLQKKIWTYNNSEELSYGLGDLHLPIGWGNIPFDRIFEKLEFAKGLILILEIQERFIEYIPETIKKAKILFDKARIYSE